MLMLHSIIQGQHFHPHPQAPWVKLTVKLTLAPGGGGGNVDPWRPLDFLEALDGQLRCRKRFFFLQTNGPHISGSPERPTTLPQALFLLRYKTPIFLEALDGQLR